MKKPTKAEREERTQFALKELRKLIRRNTTIYTVLTHCSSSGLSRRIKVLLLVKRPGRGTEIRDVSAWAARVLDWKWHDSGAVVVQGCGMDMGFHLTDCLVSALYPKGFPARNEAEKVRAGSDGKVRASYVIDHRWL